ncbi:B-cell receptor CD22-like [Lithobates pipiens]
MSVTKKILLLNLFQGLVCQKWEFPREIVGLIGSCVEVPCTFRPRERSRTSSTVWYLNHAVRYPQIFNSQGRSSVLEDYRGRTSLVPGRNSCSLRIDPVRRDDGDQSYYPGIAEDRDTNAWAQQGRRTLQLHVTDTPNIPVLSGKGQMVEGRPEIVACSVEHTCGSSPPSLRWNKAGQTERRSEDLSGGNWREILTIRYIPSYEDDKTEIQCTVTYHNGRTSHKAGTLNIRYPPKDVTVNLPKVEEILEGSDMVLTCSSRSNPPPYTYEWYRGNSKIKLRSQDQKITVRNVTKDMEPYSCTVINDVGRGESPPTEIHVLYAATGVEVVVLRPMEGAPKLKCTFISSRPNVTHYTWRKDGNILLDKTEQILVLDDEDNSGSYSCIAHNKAGNSTSAEQDFPDSTADEDSSNLTLILGVLAGIILLLFLVMIVFFYTRQKRKPTALLPPIHGEIPSHFPNLRDQDEALVQENQYGNIQANPKVHPRSQRSPHSSHVSGEQSYAIYTNEEFLHSETDIEYSTIAHTHHGRRRQDFIDGDNVNYATIKH